MTAPDTLPPELAELGELLRDDPPRPDPAWARALDDRAAAGFPRPPRRSWSARLVPPRSALLPAMGFACVLLLVAGIAVLAPGGDNGSSSSFPSSAGGGGSGAQRAAGPAQSSDAAKGGESSSLSSPPIVPPGRGGGSPGSDSRTQRLQERSAALTLAARPRDVET